MGLTVEKLQLWVAKVEFEGEIIILGAPEERRAFYEREKQRKVKWNEVIDMGIVTQNVRQLCKAH